MSAILQRQPVRNAVSRADESSAEREAWRRRVIAGPAGLALLLAGGGLLIRVTLLTLQHEGWTGSTWFFTAIACVLAGVALMLLALPKIVTPDGRDDETPSPDIG